MGVSESPAVMKAEKIKEINEQTQKKIKKIQLDDLARMKDQFARDLKNMIDVEVQKQKKEASQANKIVEKATRMVKRDLES